MANDDHVALLKQSVDAWHAWRRANPGIRPDLSGADLHGWDLRTVDLSTASLIDTDLSGALLSDVIFTGAICSSTTDLSAARLVQAKLGGVDLSGASLIDANLNRAILNRTRLVGARLVGTRLFKADLSRANLRGADLWAATLVDTDLTGADLTGARVHGVSAWRIIVDKKTKQQDLIITDVGEPDITVDNIEVAQFIYLMLNNQKVRDVIDTITSKVVLILGRFTDERKAVLDALRDELRKRDYLPILFDFSIPATRDITETISLLAHMARFVVADITDARSIPQELAMIVPDLPSVPVQPLLLEGSDEYGMFEHFKRFPWVLETCSYPSSERLIANLGERVIGPAENYARSVRE
jgi:uncharacterized protein YjbI with pentapeptide repeats